MAAQTRSLLGRTSGLGQSRAGRRKVVLGRSHGLPFEARIQYPGNPEIPRGKPERGSSAGLDDRHQLIAGERGAASGSAPIGLIALGPRQSSAVRLAHWGSQAAAVVQAEARKVPRWQ